MLGDRLRRQGRELVALCPFHDDSNPSLSINPENGLWLCRVPSCHAHEGGDFIDFTRRLRVLTFRQALQYSAERVGIDVGESATARYERIARENASFDEDALIARAQERMREERERAVAALRFIDNGIIDAFHEQLRYGDPALAAWLFLQRGITFDTCDRYKIGHTGDRYTIPIPDEEGRWVNIRQYKQNAQNGQKMISWREGFGAARLYPPIFTDGTIYLMEGEWDCLLARQHGLNAHTSTGGAGSWNPDWDYLFDGRDVIICYDNDDAGRAGATMVANRIVNNAASVRILDWDFVCGTNTQPGFDFTDFILGGYTVGQLVGSAVRHPPFATIPPETIAPVVEEPTTPDDDHINRTDVGNAKRLARRHGNDVRYVSRNWYVWDGTRYALDETGEIDRRAKETARSILTVEAVEHPSDEARQKLALWSLASESASRIHAMVDLAKSELPLAVSSSVMDANPYLLNCTNGTYDFDLHGFRDHSRNDLLTMSTNQPYDPEADCPQWEAFIRRTFDNNADIIAFVQRAIGYSLIGITTEQVLFFCYGTGANGKSTFLETVRDVIGDYARTADFSTFATQRGGHSGPRNDIMRLRGARLVTAIEFDAGRALDEIVIKQLTGGDTISARRLYSESEEFRPTFTPWIAGNHKPIIKGTDEAIWRRLRLIPFTVTIPHGERDPHLRERLMTEAPGILNWAIRGAEQWMDVGLRPPSEVLLATASYRNEMDTIEPFLESRTIREPRAMTKMSILYQEYKRWAEDSGEDPVSKMAFGLRLGEKGHDSLSRGGSQYRLGIRMRSNDDMLIPDEPRRNGNGTNPSVLHGNVEPIHDSVEREIPFEARDPAW